MPMDLLDSMSTVPKRVTIDGVQVILVRKDDGSLNVGVPIGQDVKIVEGTTDPSSGDASALTVEGINVVVSRETKAGGGCLIIRVADGQIINLFEMTTLVKRPGPPPRVVRDSVCQLFLPCEICLFAESKNCGMCAECWRQLPPGPASGPEVGQVSGPIPG